jgi:hypothetical protein
MSVAKHRLSYAVTAIAVVGIGGRHIGIDHLPHAVTAPRAHSSVSHTTAADPVMVVELFTSESCPECPPAEDSMVALSRAAQKAHVKMIPLSFHVAYWNQDGWSDPYSDTIYTLRQHAYNGAQLYTPQPIVNGETKEALSTSLLQALPAPLPRTVTIEPGTAAGAKRAINVHVAPAASAGSPTDTMYVFLAITEDSVLAHVSAGENKGKDFHHVGVVRYFRRIAKIGNAEATLSSVAIPDVPVQHGHATVLVQVRGQNHLGPIVGVETTPL